MTKLTQCQTALLTYLKTILLALCAVVSLYPALSQALTFTDDFNRPDSATVGNGWSNTAGNIGGNLEIKNNELTCPGTGGAGIFRSFPFTAPITVTAKVKEMNGFGSLLRRYVTGVWILNDGVRDNGYGVVVVRSDQNFDNSTVILVEDNVQLASIPSTFQYGPEIHVSVTFNLDGSVTGIVSEPAPSTNTFSFSFGAHAIQSTGDNFSIDTECSSGAVDPRIDDVSITSGVCDVSVNEMLINTKQDPNILFANGIESTIVRAKVNPIQQGAFLDFSTNFGTIQDGVSDIDGNVAVPYTAGILSLGGTDTTTATINVVACAVQQTVQEKVYNYRGFNFHQSNVSNPVFTDSTIMDKTDIQTFFESRGSFLAQFILVGTIGGFLDTNNNGKLDTGEPTYSATGKSIPLNSRGSRTASIFSNVATDQGINPQVLLTTAEKENSLISSITLPNAAVLNNAMGCNAKTANNFRDQIKCSARTLVNRFNDTSLFGRAITYPFFFMATDGIRHAVSERCNVQPFLPGCKQVAFVVENAATFAQYRYTPFIQSLLNGGGVFLFEKVWQSFGF